MTFATRYIQVYYSSLQQEGRLSDSWLHGRKYDTSLARVYSLHLKLNGKPCECSSPDGRRLSNDIWLHHALRKVTEADDIARQARAVPEKSMNCMMPAAQTSCLARKGGAIGSQPVTAAHRRADNMHAYSVYQILRKWDRNLQKHYITQPS